MKESIKSRSSFVITGRIAQPNGVPASKLIVAAIELSPGKESQLKTAKTDPSGNYSLTLRAADFKLSTPAQAGVVIEVRSSSGKALTRSPILFKLQACQVLNIVVTSPSYPATSEYHALAETVKKALGKSKLVDLKEDATHSDITLLAGGTGQSPTGIKMLVSAHAVGEKAKIPPSVLYSLFKAKGTTDINRILALSSDEIKSVIEEAVKDQTIAPAEGKNPQAIVDSLTRLAVTGILAEKPQGVSASLGEVLRIATRDKGVHEKILTTLANSGGDLKSSWEKVAKDLGDTTLVTRCQRVLQLAALTGNQTDMISSLVDHTDYGTSATLRRFAKWDAQDWATHIADVSKKTGKLCVPETIQGNSDADKIADYAGRIERLLNEEFPTTAFAGRLAKDKDAESAFGDIKDDVVSFLDDNPHFEFGDGSTLQVARNQGDFNFKNVGNKPKLVSELKTVKRLFRLSPEYGAIKALKGAGLDAAHKVVELSPDQFTLRFAGPLGGKAQALRIYSQAQGAYLNSIGTYVMGHPSQNHKTNVTDPQLNIADPDLRTLFGSLEQCGCEDCQSVYSPSAYFVDMLKFLKDRAPLVYAELIRRRPDLLKLELTCKNTNTPLPYVDLVNELLESLVIARITPLPTPVPPVSYQTAGASRDLAGNPEHAYRNAVTDPYISYDKFVLAYDELKKGVAPSILPFNYALEEARIYLAHLGFSRYELMRIFFPLNPQSSISEYHMAAEYLGLSKEEADIVVGVTTGGGGAGSGAWNFYGFSTQTLSEPVADPADSSLVIQNKDWVDALKGRVDLFLQQAGVSYVELLGLLNTRFLNPITSGTRKITIQAKQGAAQDTCVLKDLQLAGLEQNDLIKIYKFIRLWRKSGWPAYQLDKILMALGLSLTTTGDLVRLWEVARIGRTLHLAPEQVLSLPGTNNIESWTYTDYQDENQATIPSLYDNLFRNKAILSPLDPVFGEGGTIQPAQDAQGNTIGIAFADHKATLIAALQLSDQDLAEFMSKSGIQPGDAMTLSKISSLYRLAITSQALGLTADELINTNDLIGGNLFASLSNFSQFLEDFDSIRASGFSIAQLGYLLRHKYTEALGFVPDPALIGQFLTDLRTSLAKVAAAADVAGARNNAVVQSFATQLKLSASATGKFLGDFVPSIADGTKKALSEFIADSFVGSTGDIAEKAANGTPTAFSNLYRFYRLMDKIASVVNKLKLTDDELDLIYYKEIHNDNSVTLTNRAAAFQIVDFTQLPSASASPAVPFAGFESLLYLIQARDTMPFGTPGIFDIVKKAIDGSNTAARDLWLNAVDQRTHWGESVSDLVGNSSTLVSAGALGTNFPGDFVKGKLLLRIRLCLDAIQRTGLPAAQIAKILHSDLTAADSAAAKNAAKSKHSDDDWYALAKDLRDPLREKQRAALVAWAVAHPDRIKKQAWKNADELYEYLLTDVEMAPCMMTSRTKQALCSVQLYIDRVLLNLEHPNFDKSQPALTIGIPDAKEWNQWRKVYRVWEANRKVFLYPENWIEPELRDDKSPFFRELQAQLNQNELSTPNVEDGFLSYLEKLDMIARLQIVATYHQEEEENGIDILHVVGRTYGYPHKYFYRTFTDGEWTSWEKIEGDIDGDHIAMWVWDRRLYLFWLLLKEQSDAPSITMPTSTDPITTPKKKWGIQLCWSEYKNGKWTAKRISKDSVFTPPTDDTGNQKRVLYLRPMVDADNSLALGIVDYSDGTSTPGGHFLFTEPNHAPIVVTTALTENGLFAPTNLKYSYMQSTDTDLSKPALQYISSISLDMSDPDIDGAATIIKEDDVLENLKKFTYWLVFSSNSRGNPLEPHFFFQDSRNTFFVFLTDRERVYDTGMFGEPNRVNLGDLLKIIEATYYEVVVVVGPPVPEDPTWGSYDPAAVETPVKDFGDVQTLIGKDLTISVSGGSYAKNPGGMFFRSGKSLTNGKSAFTVRPPVSIKSWMGKSSEQPDTSASGTFATAMQPMMFKMGSKGKPAPSSATGQGGEMAISAFAKGKRTHSSYHDENRFVFQTHYHGHVKDFIHALNKDGIEGFLNRRTQETDDRILFYGNYTPTRFVRSKFVEPGDAYPTDCIDFTFGSGYSQYNWELFFHVPLYIANRLSKDQRFEEARRWYHFVFDPTSTDGDNKQRFWNFEPFYVEAGKQIQTLDDLMRSSADLSKQIAKWEKDPFNPHVIARMRILAYMKNVVMKYLDNLIAWADHLFASDATEAINEAIQLYVLAAKILGPRPQDVPARAIPKVLRFDDMAQIWSKPDNQKTDEEKALESFSNALSDIELFISPNAPSGIGGTGGNAGLKMPYFCLPRNENLLKYWDTVADRLFKIRHCMNIEGVVRQLPLFEPPIDPAMLVRAAAAGIDLSSAVSDLSASRGLYRFSYMLQKANELCSEVRALGGALLSALEKRDAEGIALLRSGHEQKLLAAVKVVKMSQIEEASASLESIQKTRVVTESKYEYYNSRTFMNELEQAHFISMTIGMVLQAVQGGLDTLGGVLHVVPNFKIGAPPSIGGTFGGENLGNALMAVSRGLGIISGINQSVGSMASTLGSYTRRMDDWHFQASSSQKELDQIDKQILGAQIRLAIAQKDSQNQDLQIQNSAEADEYLRSKFTNQDLYDWTVGQISSLYFQSYQLAYMLAKQAERCYRYELGIPDEQEDLIQFGYWDSLKKGLLAGEKLQYDLRRLDLSYIDKNKRTFELTKHVSLALLDPMKLLDLKTSGKAIDIRLPEEIFDLDFPGHYFRRIKSVSMTIPCVVGPYTSVGCTLRLKADSYRKNNLLTAATYKRAPSNDGRFIDNLNAIESIATSSGQNDSGLFELNFKDERYLPFEGRGVISTWDVVLNSDIVDPADATKKISLRQFDYETISDVILHIKYTALEGGDTLGDAAKTYLHTLIDSIGASQLPLRRYFSARHEFPSDWYKFLHPVGSAVQQLMLTIPVDHFPFLVKGNTVKVDNVHLLGRLKTILDYSVTLKPKTGSNSTLSLTKAGGYAASTGSIGGAFGIEPLTITFNKLLQEADIDDLYIVLDYHLVPIP